MQIRSDAQLALAAFHGEADRLNREAKLRKWAGPQHAEYRAKLRGEAHRLRKLAGGVHPTSVDFLAASR